MTQKLKIRVSKALPDSGSISTRSYAFVFSDRIEDWIVSNNVAAVAKQRARDRAKAQHHGLKK